jgi:hypothetical protein
MNDCRTPDPDDTDGGHGHDDEDVSPENEPGGATKLPASLQVQVREQQQTAAGTPTQQRLYAAVLQ